MNLFPTLIPWSILLCSLGLQAIQEYGWSILLFMVALTWFACDLYVALTKD